MDLGEKDESQPQLISANPVLREEQKAGRGADYLVYCWKNGLLFGMLQDYSVCGSQRSFVF
jgi:hypothetical protein